MTQMYADEDRGDVFGPHLRAPVSRGVTQTELGAIPLQTPKHSRLERGTTTPTLGMLLRLADASTVKSPT